MATAETEAVEWEAGQRFGPLCLGPVSKEAVLKMAELTGDFHPFRLVDHAAGEAGYVGLVLHPVWISGLAEALMRREFPGCRVTNLSIAYRNSALDTDRLNVTLACQEYDARQSRVGLIFTVTKQKDVVVAHGKARIIPTTPQLVRTCST
jgi:acyl dehydratase